MPNTLFFTSVLGNSCNDLKFIDVENGAYKSYLMKVTQLINIIIVIIIIS